MVDKYDWLYDDMTNMREKIRFKDRIEYRVEGKLHNAHGPAVIALDCPYEDCSDIQDTYYLNDIKYSFEEWNIKVRPTKLKKLKKKIKKKIENKNI